MGSCANHAACFDALDCLSGVMNLHEQSDSDAVSAVASGRVTEDVTAAAVPVFYAAACKALASLRFASVFARYLVLRLRQTHASLGVSPPVQVYARD